jgi:hypothetical protein
LILFGGIGSLPRLGDFFPAKLFSWGSALVLGSPEPAWAALAISLGLILAALVAALLIFRRQEL